MFKVFIFDRYQAGPDFSVVVKQTYGLTNFRANCFSLSSDLAPEYSLDFPLSSLTSASSSLETYILIVGNPLTPFFVHNARWASQSTATILTLSFNSSASLSYANISYQPYLSEGELTRSELFATDISTAMGELLTVHTKVHRNQQARAPVS